MQICSQSSFSLNNNLLSNSSKNKIQGSTSNSATKKKTQLDMLMEQKSNLVDNKNSLIENAIKGGQSQNSIKDTLDAIDKQIAEVDKQISELKGEDQSNSLNRNKTTNNKKKSKSQNISNDETEAATPINKLDNILAMSSSLSNVNALLAEKKSMTGQVKVIESDIKFNESLSLPPDPTKKLSAIKDLSERIGKIDNKFNDELKNINQKSKENSPDNISGNNSNISKVNNTTSNAMTAEGNSEADKTSKSPSIQQEIISEKIKHYQEVNKKSYTTLGRQVNIVA